MNKHTPGPWRVGDAGAAVFGPKRSDNVLETIATLSKRPLILNETKANARLIACAPEMLEALEAVHRMIGDDPSFDFCSALIAKARGE